MMPDPTAPPGAPRPRTPTTPLHAAGNGRASPKQPLGRERELVAIVASGSAATAATATGSEAVATTDGDALRRVASGGWHDVASDPPETPGHIAETLAHRLHRAFSYTAVPTGVLLAIFLLGLLLKAKMEAHTVGRAIAAYCAAMSVIMTGLLIHLHLSAYTDPVQQRRIVRILLMVPIYAVDSCLALWKYEFAPVIGTIRDVYEAYCIYSFFWLLMGYLGGEEEACNAKNGAKVNHLFPLCCLPPFQLSQRTFRLWKFLVTQYVVIKPVLAIVTALLMVTGHYEESSWSFDNAHVYFVIMQNVIVTLAFTSLVYFFMEYKTLLVRHQPMGKFAAVKAVVFLSFWQSVLLGLLVHFGYIAGSREGLWTKEEVSTGVQDFVICVEMLMMCYVHHHVFSEQPYVPLTGHQPVRRWHLLHVFSIRDVVEQTFETVTDIGAITATSEGAKHL